MSFIPSIMVKLMKPNIKMAKKKRASLHILVFMVKLLFSQMMELGLEQVLN